MNSPASESAGQQPAANIVPDREPRRVEYTICTAVAPEAVFTVRTYTTGAALRTRLMRKFRRPDPQNQQVKLLPAWPNP
jgi:hypothetical protein